MQMKPVAVFLFMNLLISLSVADIKNNLYPIRWEIEIYYHCLVVLMQQEVRHEVGTYSVGV